MATDLVDSPTSLLTSWIDEIEVILTSPGSFTSSTPELLLSPLLSKINTYENYDERIIRVEKWCNQLVDATRAAHARETILEILSEVESWGDWDWEETIEDVGEKKERIEEIKRTLNDLPIEWLKTRVTGTISIHLFLFFVVNG